MGRDIKAFLLGGAFFGCLVILAYGLASQPYEPATFVEQADAAPDAPEEASEIKPVYVHPDNQFADRDLTIMCGKGWNASCLKITTPGVYETPGRTPVEKSTAEDEAMCHDYYQYFVATGQADPYVDSYCYKRWLTPEMAPDLSR